jgi:hypothetical protein
MDDGRIADERISNDPVFRDAARGDTGRMFSL